MSFVDRSNMLALLEEFPSQCRQAIEIGRLAASHLIIDLDHISNLMILGMGGSGITGDVIRVLLADQLELPILVNKSYTLPACIGKDSLVFAVSYSGDTEETLAAATGALSRGAQLIGVSSGGKLERLTGEKDLSLIKIPAGLQPRAAIGYLTLPILISLNYLGLALKFDEECEELTAMLDGLQLKWRAGLPTADNEAKQLAEKMYGNIPLVYGGDGLSGLAALRWKCQFNENSKVPAFWNQFPELNHNEIAGWEKLADVSRRFYLVNLRDLEEHPQVAKRFKVTGELIGDRFAGTAEFISEGESRLARFFSLVYLGDFTSVYLAILNGIDPTPVDRIQLLKAKLVEN